MKYILVALLIPWLSPLPACAQSEPETPVITKQTRQIDPGFSWPLSPKDDAVRRIAPPTLEKLLAPFVSDVFSSIDDAKFTFIRMDPGLPVLAIRAKFDGRPISVIDLVRCLGTLCTFWSVDSTGFENLEDEFLDFDGNGFSDLVAAKPLDSDQPLISVFRICRMVNGDLSDITKGNMKAAPKLLALVQEQKIESEKASVELPEDSDSTGADKPGRIPEELRDKPAIWKAQNDYARDDYDRVVLGHVTAGLDHAKEWKQSTIQDIRFLAITAFEKIATREALRQLDEMTTTHDKLTADRARGAIEQIQLHGSGMSSGHIPTSAENKDK